MDSKIAAIILLLGVFLINPTPMINSIDPNYGLNNGTVDVIIKGEKIDDQATLKLAKPGEPDIVGTNIKVISKKQINCSFDLQGRKAGKWDVIVANQNHFTKKVKAVTLAEGFTVQYPAPAITTIDPNHGLNLKIVSANLTGTGFRTGARVILNKGDQTINAKDVIVTSPDQITSRFDLEGTNPGIYDVKVINDDEKTGILENGFIIGNPAPEVASIIPNRGIISEAITAMITGSNFRTGAKVVLNQNNQTFEALGVKVISGTQISSKLNLVGVSPGSCDVKVINDDEKSGLLTGGFQVEYPAPTVAGIEPNLGLNSEKATVNLSGTNFRTGAKVELCTGNKRIKAADVKVISESRLFTILNLVGTVPGTYDVKVTNDDGKSGSLAKGFRIEYPAPTVTGIEPKLGLNSEKMTVNLTGTNLRTGVKVELCAGDHKLQATNVKVKSSSRISAEFNLVGSIPGTYDAKVTNDDGKSGLLTGGFRIEYPAPTVTGVEPKLGLNSEKVTVNLTGTYLRTGAKVELCAGDQKIQATNVKVKSSSPISAEFNLVGSIPGTYDAKVTNDDGKSGLLTGGFKIEYPAPTVTGVEPKLGLNSEKVTINLIGTYLRTGAKVELCAGDQKIKATNVKVKSSSLISAEFNLAGSIPGTYDAKVTNDDGKSGLLTGGFMIEYPAPSVSGIKPSLGLNSEKMTINLSGINFRTGAKVELCAGDQKIQATVVNVLSNSLISAGFNLVGSIPGTYDVKVINDDGKSGLLRGGFGIEYPAPFASGIKPSKGLNSELLTVNLNGTNFRTGAKVELCNGTRSIQATDVKVKSGSRISAVFNLEGSVPGIYDVKVTNDDGKSGSLTGGFEIIVKPNIKSIVPNEGFNNGSLLTEINGANFESGALVKLVGPGQVEIPGLNTKIKNPREITCFFDLNKKPIGSYDVIVINPNGQRSILPNGFMVKEYIPNSQEINDRLKPIFFDFDRFEIRTDQISTLEEDAIILNENPDLYILLGGHADERGTREYNLELSERRAYAIREFLLEKGVDPSKISIYAYGKDYPLKKGHDESSWWYNRRVDIIVWESPPSREQGLIEIVNSDGGTNN